MGILYGCNTFSFTEIQVLRQFASAIVPENLSSIRSLQFENYLFGELWYSWPYLHPWGKHGEWADTQQILSRCQGLREVRVKVDIPTNGFDESENVNDLIKHLMEGTKVNVVMVAM